MNGIDTIFSVWPSAEAMASDLGIPGVTVRQWRNRSGSIPARYWAKIQHAAARRGHVLPIALFTPADAIVAVEALERAVAASGAAA